MSRIGKKPIELPKGVTVELKGRSLKVKGSLGEMAMDVHSDVKVKVESDAIILVNEKPDARWNKQIHGTMRALAANMVTGVSKGFERKMEIFGTGYNLKEQSGKLIFQVGFCHPVEVKLPKGVKVQIEVPATRGNDVPAKFSVNGTDKAVIGQLAANIREIKPPEPYKGKGIRYADEHVRRKVGKAFATGGV